MADSNFSQVFPDLESDEISLETSVPADTFSPDDRGRRGKLGRDLTKNKRLFENKQLLHDLQLCKIELSQREMIIDNLKAQHHDKTEELEEKLNEAIYQKKIIQAELESKLQIQNDKSKRYHESMRNQLQERIQKLRKLEESNTILKESITNVKNQLLCLDLTEEKYNELRSQNEDVWSIRDLVAVKLFEKNLPLQNEIHQLKRRLSSYESRQKSLDDEVKMLQKNLDEERLAHGKSRVALQKANLDLSACRAQVQSENYCVTHFYSVKDERDRLEKENCDLKKQNLSLDSSTVILRNEKDETSRQLTSAKQEMTLLTQDKNYLTRQVNDLTHRCSLLSEKLESSNLQLEDAKKSREEMYEKYASSRDQYKCEYEIRLREELEMIRSQTNSEIERLRTSTKELYERENRNLREAREMAIIEKEKSGSNAQEVYAKYEKLLNDFRTLQTTGEQRLLDLQSEVKLKSFEAERSHLSYEEVCKNITKYQLEIEKLETKYKVLLKEYYAMEGAKNKKITELESELSSKNSRLESYDKLEHELDNVILQAAESEEKSNTESVLLAYGYGANVSINAKRQLKQSVDLARRVLQLERTNTNLKQELEAERDNVKEKMEEIESCKELLESVQQPHSYLIESIKNRNELLKKHKKSLQEAEQRISNLLEERLQMMQTQNQMSEDLECLLKQQAEISLIKQILTKMSKAGSEAAVSESDINVYKPGSISFHKT